ncbi:hypothetical protein V1520DRAFT_348246 [Lipomyces starkeyi]|uniref:Uncharacterized protein n=1 Tax=Lipomyces starkeyi NRRL Y-11557 TaxID=675824 RepID=A0A1E3Q1B7_LIPST|nr:hypothetical protein LIPSTDRAFT_73182 [Lipomyces starkeyi NRRL Y-11557]
MPKSPPAPSSSVPLPSRPCSEPATYVDFVNPLLLVLFTNLVFSLGPSLVRASDIHEGCQVVILIFGAMTFVTSKLFEAVTVAELLDRSPSLSGRTVTTTFLLAAHVGLLAPWFMSDLTLFTDSRLCYGLQRSVRFSASLV